jgi:hypothetical protein
MAAVVPYARLIGAAWAFAFTSADRGAAKRRLPLVAAASDLNFALERIAGGLELALALRDAH